MTVKATLLGKVGAIVCVEVSALMLVALAYDDPRDVRFSNCCKKHNETFPMSRLSSCNYTTLFMHNDMSKPAPVPLKEDCDNDTFLQNDQRRRRSVGSEPMALLDYVAEVYLQPAVMLDASHLHPMQYHFIAEYSRSKRDDNNNSKKADVQANKDFLLCMSNAVNNKECCKVRQVPPECLPGCDGSAPDVVWKLPKQPCDGHLPDILKCHYENSGLIDQVPDPVSSKR